MRQCVLIMVLLASCAFVTPADGQDVPFLGRWDVTATSAKGTYPLWLEVKNEKGQLTGLFQDRTGSVRAIPEIALEGGQRSART